MRRRGWLLLALAAGCGGADGLFGDGGIPEPRADAPVTDPCGPVDEREPNDGRDQAAPLVSGSAVRACVASREDRDHFALPVPSTAAGALLRITLDEVGEGAVGVRVYAARDEGVATEQYATTPGQSLSVFVAAAAGAALRAQVYDFTGFARPYRYRIAVASDPIPDAFEPNDTRAAAKTIPVGTAQRAALAAGFSTSDAPRVEEYDDWYAVTLQRGAVTVRLDEVPANVAAAVSLHDGNGAVIEDERRIEPGVTLVLRPAQVITAGPHFVKVGLGGARPPAEGKAPPVPEHLTRQYRLTVTQP